MRTLRLPAGMLLVASTLGAGLAVGASAAPVAKTVATVECQGASATLLMHPGEGGKAIWDISDDSVQNAPTYLIKRIEGNVFVGGELVGALDKSVGSKTGFAADPYPHAAKLHLQIGFYGWISDFATPAGFIPRLSAVLPTSRTIRRTKPLRVLRPAHRQEGRCSPSPAGERSRSRLTDVDAHRPRPDRSRAMGPVRKRRHRLRPLEARRELPIQPAVVDALGSALGQVSAGAS